jgi:hypothetical protein
MQQETLHAVAGRRATVIPSEARNDGMRKRLMYEHQSQPLLTNRAFLVRWLRHASVAALIVIGSLALGMLGYHQLEGLSWVDSLLNASMLLGGMGPVAPLQTTVGKIFASLYALYSGIIFLAIAGILFAPIFHRIMHRLHLEQDSPGE